MNKKISALILLVFLNSCTKLPSVGPDFKEPELKVPNEFQSQKIENNYIQAKDISPEVIKLKDWWKNFGDTKLDEFIDRALANNKDIKIASSRLTESRLLSNITAAQFFPSVTANGSQTRTRTSEGSNFVPPINPTNQSRIGFDASWEIDIFGGNRREFEASLYSLRAQEENYRDTLLTLFSEVARTYINLKTLDKRIGIAEKNIRAQSDSLNLVDARYTAGLVSELDVSQSKAQLESTKATLPSLQSQRTATLNSLAVLLGENSDDTNSLFQAKFEDKNPNKILGNIPYIPVSVPSIVLANRPDIKRAEMNLGEATANIGVAIADYYPKFSITGSYGLQSIKSAKLFQSKSNYWNFGPSIQFPIFQGGRIFNNVKVQNERQQQALLNYEKTILTAFGEVENSLTSYAYEIKRFESLQNSFNANKRAKNLSDELYKQGLTDFLRVLEAERATFSSEDNLAQSEASILINAIGLYKAIGGGV